MSETERIRAAADLGVEGGFCDGGHHKQWYLDQIIRILLGAGYQPWRDEMDASGHEWDEGIGP